MTGYPEFEALLVKAKSLPAGDVPRFLGRLKEIEATAQQALSTQAPAQQPDSLIDVTEAALRLGLSENYLYRNSRKYPFTRREGRKLLFSSAGIERHIKQSR